jgi:hypothetical protein
MPWWGWLLLAWAVLATVAAAVPWLHSRNRRR